jgi:hypothetical protein
LRQVKENPQIGQILLGKSDLALCRGIMLGGIYFYFIFLYIDRQGAD